MKNLLILGLVLMGVLAGCDTSGCRNGAKCHSGPSECWSCGTSDSLDSLDYTEEDVANIVEGTWQGDYDDPEYGPFAINVTIALDSPPKAGVLIPEEGCEVPATEQDRCDSFTSEGAVTGTVEPDVWKLPGTLRIDGKLGCGQPTTEDDFEYQLKSGCPTFIIHRHTITEPDGGGDWVVTIIPDASGKLWAKGSEGLVEIGAKVSQ